MALSRASSDQSIKLSSTTASDTSNETNERHPSIETRVCLIGAAGNNDILKSKLKRVKQMEVLVVNITKRARGKDKYQHSVLKMDLKIPFLLSKDGREYMYEDDPYYETIFILEDFEGELFDELRHTDNRILGPPVISAIAASNEPLPYTSRPLYCTCMQGLNLCFTNFKTKEHLAHLVTLCHYMGACIKKEMSSKIDYLVTNSLHGPKYRTAVSLGTPVMKEEWIHSCWAARRRENTYQATDDEFLSPCKSKPFEGCSLSFLGFSDHEKKHMQEQTQQQGGSVTEVGDHMCTHLVVDENVVKSLPFEPEGRLYVVVQEWFWGSIQIEAKAAESMYIFELVEYPKMLTRSSTTSSLLGTPKWKGSTSGLSTRSRASAGKTFSRKRPRLREETLAKLAQDTGGDASTRPPRKRPSTDTSACIPDSMLDMSNNTTAASLKSPNTPDNVFRGRRRSARLRSRQKLDSDPDLFEICSSASHRRSDRLSLRMDKTRMLSHATINEHKATPSILLNTFQEVEKGSPGTSNHEIQAHGSKSGRSTARLCSEQNTDKLSEEFVTVRQRLRRKRKSSELNAGFESPCLSRIESEFKIPTGSPPSKKKSAKKEQSREATKQKRRFSLSADAFRVGKLTVASGAFRRLSVLTGFQSKQSLLTCNENLVEIAEDSVVNEDSDVEVEVDGNVLNANLDVVDDETLNECVESDKIGSPKPAVSARYQVAMEFLQTEKNYVGILQTIVNLFKKPLDDPNQAGGPILASEDIKAIFGSLSEIEAVHRSMSDDLRTTMQKWNDDSCIGQLVLKYAEDFGRCYPPFVNFFEVSVETIARCEARSSRFHAFLKINQAKKECGRQTLAELLINPVQRLPRIILLLQDIKKHSERDNPSHPDIAGIHSSIEALKEVMTHINEDKRKTESQRQIFDIVYEVDGCPPTVVSSHRKFIARAEMIAVDDNLCNKGDHISLYIFSDCVEIAKRRRGVKSSNSFKSPNVHSRPPSNAKSLKHVKLMSLLHIKKVVDINDSEDCENAVALYCRTPTDTQDWLYTFKVLTCSDDGSSQQNEEPNTNKENTPVNDTAKSQLLRLLAKNRANTVCKASDDNFVCVVNSHELEVCTADLGSTLGRAVRAAKKSSRKLTRAFSFSRTPRRVVQRAVTNMLSPSQQRPPTGLARADSTTSRDMETDETSSSGLTPSMSVTSLCTPQRDRRGNRLPSTSSLQYDEDSIPAQYPTSPTLKGSVSTMNLARPPTAADVCDFPAIPTPPARRRKVGTAIKAATIAFGRTGSFRKRRNKFETAV